ncbi:hypothetical protein ACFOZY_08070 [Chungangia koreensis]|uniref:Uncharacterized protein n=1 Tax=Chungangia koreensis TaxID=752657 RepID=A0ABV8X7V9_9LACT
MWNLYGDAFYWYVLTPDVHLKTLNIILKALKTVGDNSVYDRIFYRMEWTKLRI